MMFMEHYLDGETYRLYEIFVNPLGQVCIINHGWRKKE